LISLHGFTPVFASSKDQPTKFAQSDINVFHVSAKFILDDEIVRSLVSESCNVFHSLQVLKDKTNDVYLQTSRIYRSAIRTTLNKLQEAASEDEDPESVKKYESYVTIFYAVECLWHLCEFLLIDRSTVSVVPNLLEWVRD
jgi:nuclear pore complex protein Nup85